MKSILRFKRKKANIIVCHDLNTLPIGSYFRIRNKSVKLLYDTHEFFPSMIEESWGRSSFWVFASLEKPLIKRADYITTISQSMAYYLKTYYNLTQPMNYIFNAPKESIAALPKLDVEREENEIIFVNVGKVSAINRGFELLPEFATHLKTMLKPTDPKIKLLIFGDGQYRKTIHNIVKSKGYDDIIKFLGHIPYDKAMSLSKSCDVGIILTQATSLNNLYSGPNRIFDYMGNYLSLLVTDLFEFKRIAEGNECGWVIPVGNPKQFATKVLEIARNKSDIEEKKENVKRLFHKKYTWERMEEKILSIYEKL